MKFSTLLRALLLPFLAMSAGVVGDDGGGATAEDRGDLLLEDAPDASTDDLVDPMKDAKDEKADAKVDDEKADPADDAEADDKKVKKDTRIPLARHKEMLDKARAENDRLVVELAKAQGVKDANKLAEQLDATETRIVAMEEEYNKFLAAGEMEKASAKMTEIRRLERTVRDTQALAQSQIAESRAVERVRYDTVVERLENAYPAMNPDHDDYDVDKVTEILDLKGAFEAKGLTASAALQKAVKYVLPAETSKQETATEVTPNASKEDVAKVRKQEALKRNIDAAKRTPASTAKVGTNNEDGGELTAEKAMKMTQTEFAKLDENTLAKMRGDIL